MNQLDHQTFSQSLSAQAQQARRPDSATIELTYGCNLRCVHCYNPTHRALPQELTTEEVRSILTQMANLGVLTVSLSGGEPSLRPDIEEILGHARRAGLLVSLLTNATRMTPAFAARLEELAVAQVFVSIYGEGRILRFSPQAQLVGMITLPTRYSTNIAFNTQGDAATTGSFINDEPPFPGEVRFHPAASLTRRGG